MQARVLLLCPGLLGNDGVATVSRQIARAILSSGASLRVLCLGEEAPPAAPAWLGGVATDFAAGDRKRFVMLAAREALRPRAATHVVSTHVHLAPAALPSVARGARALIYLHSLEVWGQLSALRILCLRTADRLLANSTYTSQRFLSAHPVCAGCTILRCWPGAAEDADSIPLERRALNERFALIVGRLDAREQYKGHDLLLELWQRVHARTGLQLVIAGDGDDRTRLLHKAESLGLAACVQVRGRVSDRELAALYRDCEFFAMPGRDEGFGLVYVEAMRAGKACLAGTGAPEEVVLHEQTGLIVDPGQRDNVLAAILRLADDADLRNRLGEAGLARARTWFTEQAFQRRFLDAAGLLTRY
jgi:phosphatidylinositol alpha-1,6-mannosyltransferase